jgi:nucleoside-diphosphate-sugar epimerase
MQCDPNGSETNSMRILIIGNTSMLGKRLISALGELHQIKTAGRSGQYDIYLDLNNLNVTYESKEIFDVIIHCAASFRGDELKDSLHNEMTNSIGVFHVGKIAIQSSCQHLIYISSLSIYNHIENSYYGSYGLSKKHGQENLEFICDKHGIKFTSLIPAQLYDEYGEAQKHQKLLYGIINSLNVGNTISIHHSNEVLRNYLFINDFVEIIKKVVDLQVTGIFNCIYPLSYNIQEIINIASSVLNKKPNLKFVNDVSLSRTIYIPSDRLINEQINYTPTTDLRQGINLISKFMLNNS